MITTGVGATSSNNWLTCAGDGSGTLTSAGDNTGEATGVRRGEGCVAAAQDDGSRA